MVRESWRSFLFVFLVSCLNKETTILLTLVFVVHFWKHARLSLARFWTLLLLQLGIFTAVKAVLFVGFRANPGSFVEVHLDHNWAWFDPQPWGALFAWGGFVLLLRHRWAEKPVFLRHALWILVPLLLMTFVFGFLNERRVFYEVYPIVLLLLFHSIRHLSGTS